MLSKCLESLGKKIKILGVYKEDSEPFAFHLLKTATPTVT
jgi:hypothetical protein